jgi:hypothetical protein
MERGLPTFGCGCMAYHLNVQPPHSWATFSSTSARLRFRLIPSVAVFLLLVGLFEAVNDLLAPQTADACRDEIDHGQRSDVARRVRETVDRHDEKFIGEASQGREHGVRDAHAVCPVLLCSLDAFDGHAKTSAKANANNNVALISRASKVSRAAWSDRRQHGQAGDRQVVFHVADERRGHVAAQEKNPFSFMDSRSNAQYLLQIDMVLDESEILLDLLP